MKVDGIELCAMVVVMAASFAWAYWFVTDDWWNW